MVSFIDAHRDAHGVEPICSVLPIYNALPKITRVWFCYPY